MENKKQKIEEQKNLNEDGETIEKLKLEIETLKIEKKVFEEELNQKFLDLIEKKSKEASEILIKKTKEIEEKISADYQSKKDYMYEDQLTNLVELFAQFEVIVNSEVSSQEVKNYLVGFQMFLQQFKQLLVDFKIEELSPSKGDEFNSTFMNAINTEKVKTDNEKNKVLSVYSKGFKLNNRIIKLSEVLVGI